MIAATLYLGTKGLRAFCQPLIAPGTAMTKEYVQTVGRMAYMWGWPLVNMANRGAGMAEVPEPTIVGGMPVGWGGLAMLTTCQARSMLFPPFSGERRVKRSSGSSPNVKASRRKAR